MRALLPSECDELIKSGKGDRLLMMAEAYNALVHAKVDITVNQFRSMYSFLPTSHKDERGEASILDADEVREGDKPQK